MPCNDFSRYYSKLLYPFVFFAHLPFHCSILPSLLSAPHNLDIGIFGQHHCSLPHLLVSSLVLAASRKPLEYSSCDSEHKAEEQGKEEFLSVVLMSLCAEGRTLEVTFLHIGFEVQHSSAMTPRGMTWSHQQIVPSNGRNSA